MPRTRTLLLVLAGGALLASAAPTSARPNCGGPGQPSCPDPRDPPPPPPRTVKGTLRPKYMILTVVYAPPGTNGGKSSSQVEYGNGSTTGTTLSTSSAFKAGVKVTASAGGGLFGGATVTSEFEATKTATDTSSLDVKKSSTNIIRAPGGGKDGIDHDKDLIYLWLNPKVNLTITGSNVEWSLGVDGPAMRVTYSYVGWLKNPQTMQPNLKQLLASAGITEADFPAILAADPFARGATAIDPNRFVQTTTTLPYIPPYSAADAVPTWTYQQKGETVAAAATKVENETAVGLSIEASVDFAGLAKSSLKVADTFKWTASNTRGRSEGANQSASVTVGGPAFGYTGPIDIAVYWDTLYNSFMFAPAPDLTVTAQGTVTDAAGRPAANREIALEVGGAVRRTFTDARGQYRFVGTPKGPGRILIGKQAIPVNAVPNAPKTPIKLP